MVRSWQSIACPPRSKILAASSECPVVVGADQQHAGAVVRADEIAAAAERDGLRVDVSLERAAVEVFGAETPIRCLAELLLAADAEAPCGVGGQQRRDLRAVLLEAGVVRDPEIEEPWIAHAILRASREVPRILERNVRRDARRIGGVVDADLDLAEL